MNCKNCQKNFAVSATELALREKLICPISKTQLAAPIPTLCPECRAQRLFAFRNERHVYKNTCRKCNKGVVSLFQPDSKLELWCTQCWMQDDWDATDYGVEIDWNSSFLDQVKKLFETVPQRHVFMTGSENSDYCSYLNNSSDCYLTFLCYDSSACLYSYDVKESRDIVDSYKVAKSELLYECAHCQNCYALKYSDHCKSCSDSAFLSHCIGCSSCFGCCNLRQKQYCVFNEQLTKKQYEDFISQAKLNHFSSVEHWRIKFEEFRKSQPLPPDHNSGCQNVRGDYLVDCKNCIDCFCLTDSVDCNSCFRFWGLKECSFTATGSTELGLENISGIGMYTAIGNYLSHESSYLTYCKDVLFSKNCLGCVGLRRKEYSILNKEYSPEQYAVLSRKILCQLEECGELGEFFPISFSPFPYNDSLAGDLFPITEAESAELRVQWRQDHVQLEEQKSMENEISDALEDFREINYPLPCARTKKLYRIIPQELEIYRKLNIPIPRLAPLARMEELLRFQPEYRLKNNTCARQDFDGKSCQESFSSAFVSGLAQQKSVCRQCYEELVD